MPIEKIKKSIPLIFAVGFIALVVFYKPNIQNLNTDNSADISNLIELQTSEEVVYYGILYRYSTSGELGFYFYDIENDRLEQPENPKHWFWAGPEDINNDEQINKILEVVDKNPEAIFKITGIQNSDDLGYYEDGSPVSDITIKKIEVYKK